MKLPVYFVVLFFFIVILQAGTAAAEQVRLQLKWYHQAQFAGFYVAKEKRFYENHGLDVVFFEGGPGINPALSIIEKRSDFAVSSPEDLLIERSSGNQIKAIAAIYRKSAVVFLSRKDSGILKPFDFKDKTVAVKSNKGLSDFGLQFHALMKNASVDTRTMSLVPYDPDYKGFIAGDVDITPAYFTGGLIKLNLSGEPVHIIYPGDYRVRFYSDTLLAADNLMRKNPGLVSRFVRATLKGWKYAIENIEESIPMVLTYARIKNPELQQKMLEAAVPLIHTGEDCIGWMRLDEWEHMYRILLDQRIINTPIDDLELVFTNRFLEKGNKN